ncbi:EIN3-binding F-box protein 1-like [Rhododendron vialii]|uniref:EIN3-binding F-box protein 1-like n=1 Tax=Rhododendron vialii TaxID=182163 RepID=UPI00265FD98A|nr:EIN3-binding F-box protein 1-like [Rhododendron vialii]
MAESWQDLPDECWELIFNPLLLRHPSHLESLSLSCKRFLSITNTLRTHFNITHPSLIGPLSKLFNRYPRLNSLDIINFRHDDLHRIMVDVATNSNLDLQTLDLSGAEELPLEGLKVLGSRMKNVKVLCCFTLLTLRDHDLDVIADSMPCLEDLDISYPLDEGNVTDRGIEVVSCKLKGLRRIDISGNEKLTDKSLLALSTNCVYLTDLVVGCSLVTSHGIEFVLRNSTNLSFLSVSEIDFGRLRLDDYSIRCARNLSNLAINYSVVPDEYLHFLAKMTGIPLKGFALSQPMSPCFTFSGISSLLNKHRSLEWLSLDGIDFLTDEKMSDLSQYLSALVTISLNRCGNLTELTFFKLAKNCPFLEEIGMEETNLGGGGNKATDIVRNPQIKSVNLENNPNLSDECLAKLASVCPSLELLDVSSCKGITEKGIADFFKSGSKIKKLWINECEGIMNIGHGFELPELEVLGAARSGINDHGLVVIGNRCGKLLKLNLGGCLGVTVVGLKGILTNCKRLRRLNLTGCLNVSMLTVNWMVFSRPSLRKIIQPHSYLPSLRKLFLCMDVLFRQPWSCVLRIRTFFLLLELYLVREMIPLLKRGTEIDIGEMHRIVLRNFEPLDRALDGSDFISAFNDQEPFITELRSEPSDARSDGSEVHNMVLHTPLHSTIPIDN